MSYRDSSLTSQQLLFTPGPRVPSNWPHTVRAEAETAHLFWRRDGTPARGGSGSDRRPREPQPGRPPRPRPPRGRYPQTSPQSPRRPSQLPRAAQTRDRPPRVWFSAGGLASPVPRPGPKPGPPVLRGHRGEVSVDFIPGLPAGRGPSTCQSVEERRQRHHPPPGDRGRGDGSRRRGGDGLATETSGALAGQSGLTAPRLGRPLGAGSRTGGSRGRRED